MELFDSHSHYNDESFNENLEETIKMVYDSGVTKTVCIGYNVEQSKKAIEIAENHDFIYATCGISPNDSEDFSEENLNKIENLAKNPKVTAIGEIGLDYYWNKDNKDLQIEYFKKQIDIANKLNKPITIHTRDAVMDTLEILKSHPADKKGIFHCCPLNQELIKEGLKLGYYISFSGVITFKNAKAEECIKLVPDNRLLIETDSPYLTPEPFRGRKNDPSKVRYTAMKIAEVKGISLEEVARITYQNALDIYEI